MGGRTLALSLRANGSVPTEYFFHHRQSESYGWPDTSGTPPLPAPTLARYRRKHATDTEPIVFEFVGLQ